MKTAEKILSKYKSIPEQNLIHESSVLEAMEEYKDECLLYCGPADWDGVAAAKIQELKLQLHDVKAQYKESCYVIGKMSIENTNLKEENNRLAVIVSAQEKEIKELGEQIDNVCEHCNGLGYDPYPNHDTTMRPCPKCSEPE